MVIAKLTKAQRTVLEYLALNPDATLSGNPPFNPPWWDVWLCGRTPRLNASTFNALHMRELIHSVGYYPPEYGLPERYVYQLAPKGLDALLSNLQEN